MGQGTGRFMCVGTGGSAGCDHTPVLSDLTIHATIQPLYDPYNPDATLFQDALGVSDVDVHVYAKLCLFWDPMAVAHQAPLSIGFSRQKHWSGLPCPSSGDLPGPGIEPMSSASAGSFFTTQPPGKPYAEVHFHQIPQSQHRQQQLKSIEFKHQVLINFSQFRGCQWSLNVNPAIKLLWQWGHIVAQSDQIFPTHRLGVKCTIQRDHGH